MTYQTTNSLRGPAEKTIFSFIEVRIYQNPSRLLAQVQRMVIECSRHGTHQRSMTIGMHV